MEGEEREKEREEDGDSLHSLLAQKRKACKTGMV